MILESGDQFLNPFLSHLPWMWAVSCFEKCLKLWFRKRYDSVSIYLWEIREILFFLQFFVDFDRFGVISDFLIDYTLFSDLDPGTELDIILPVLRCHIEWDLDKDPDQGSKMEGFKIILANLSNKSNSKISPIDSKLENYLIQITIRNQY